MGENPVACGGDQEELAQYLSNLEFLVVQDIFITETASLADVILPASAFAEKLGTYTNMERRVQLNQPALEPPGEVFPDWAVLVELAEWFGFEWDYVGPEEVFDEIASLTPDYSGMSYRRLVEQGLQWPCPSDDHPGTKYLHQDSFSRGKGLFAPIDYNPEKLQMEEGHSEECCATGGHSCQCLSETLNRRSVVSAFKKGCCA